MTELKHRHIIRLYDVFEEPQFYYLITEKMLGGELFDRIVQKSYYNEKEARDVCVILFEALKYCHDHKVAHRDLKPENLLLTVSAMNNILDSLGRFSAYKMVRRLTICYSLIIISYDTSRVKAMTPTSRLPISVSQRSACHPIHLQLNAGRLATSLLKFWKENHTILRQICGP